VIRELKARGYTIVLVEQNFRFAAPLADRHYVLEHGQIVATITAAELEAEAWSDAARVPGRLSPPPAAVRLAQGPLAIQLLFLEETPEKTTIMQLKLPSAGLALRRCTRAQAQISGGVVKIGVLTDMSGLYSDIDGPGSVRGHRRWPSRTSAPRQGPSFKVEMVSADHQNKADIAANKAREWFDTEGVDMLTER
jgi:ABC-type glutathione transport system ATPase component